MCLTFGRVQLLEEAVQSFLQQDYEGEKELLVLNDAGRQRLCFDHPEVTIVNAPERFPTLGEKRNAAVAMCRYNTIAVWDDDDISLPHRLSYSVRYLDGGARMYQCPGILRYGESGFEQMQVDWAYMTGIWERSLFRVAGGYPHLDSREDEHLHGNFARVLGRRDFVGIPDDRLFYVYRRGLTDTYHISGAGGGDRYATIGSWVDRQVDAGSFPSGEIELHPNWSRDWTLAVHEWQQSHD